jgi:hypothetical protein
MTHRATLFALAVTAAALGACNYLDRRSHQAARDWSPQAVDGAVSYFAGNVSHDEDGDALPGSIPDALRLLLTGARGVFDDARSKNWSHASKTVRAMNAAWRRYQAGGVPPSLEVLMAKALEDLTDAVADRKPVASRQAALDVTRNGLGLLLQYRSHIEVDFERLDLWTRQAIVDAEARDAATVASDVVVLKWLLDRLAHTGDRRVRRDALHIRQQLATLQAASERGNFSTMLRAAQYVQELLRGRHRERAERVDGAE